MIIISANDLLSLKSQLDNLPVLIKDINIENIIKVQNYLKIFYGLDAPITLYSGGKFENIFLKEVSNKELSFDSYIFLLPDQSYKKDCYTFGDICRIMEKLTGKGGCPWDINQTHESIRSNMIEEAYEAVTAIDAKDTQNLIEELGDVMLQSIFHADIAKRSGEFELSDVINRLASKLVNRHTHIFGLEQAENEQQALKNWEEAKANEKANSNQDKDKVKEYLGFPALLRAQKIIKKLSKNNKLNDNNSLLKNIDSNTDFGKLLFDCVVACYKHGIDAEVELNKYLNSLLKNE